MLINLPVLVGLLTYLSHYYTREWLCSKTCLPTYLSLTCLIITHLSDSAQRCAYQLTCLIIDAPNKRTIHTWKQQTIKYKDNDVFQVLWQKLNATEDGKYANSLRACTVSDLRRRHMLECSVWKSWNTCTHNATTAALDYCTKIPTENRQNYMLALILAHCMNRAVDTLPATYTVCLRTSLNTRH